MCICNIYYTKAFFSLSLKNIFLWGKKSWRKLSCFPTKLMCLKESNIHFNGIISLCEVSRRRVQAADYLKHDSFCCGTVLCGAHQEGAPRGVVSWWDNTNSEVCPETRLCSKCKHTGLDSTAKALGCKYVLVLGTKKILAA